MDIYHHTYQSPVGPLGLSGTDDHMSAIIFDPRTIITMDTLPDVFRQCIAELDSYFAGGREGFLFPCSNLERISSKQCGNNCWPFLMAVLFPICSWPNRSIIQRAYGRWALPTAVTICPLWCPATG